ncbi:MRC1-like domain-containing protein [Chytriomyces cf. hyalinus JEL632]|nr:MRC1-like domain-containing protein [Chytriomyces cf. hyalinus JEL632]
MLSATHTRKRVVADSDSESDNEARITARIVAQTQAEKLAALMDEVVPVTGDLAVIAAQADAELDMLRAKYGDMDAPANVGNIDWGSGADGLLRTRKTVRAESATVTDIQMTRDDGGDPLFSDDGLDDDTLDKQGAGENQLLARLRLKHASSPVADGNAAVHSESDNSDQDDACDSDGNVVEDEADTGRSKISAVPNRTPISGAEDGDMNQVIGGEGASQGKRRSKGASKKEMLTMRMTSERLQRATFVELPARRGNMDINSFLSLFNMKRPASSSQANLDENSDDENDSDYQNNEERAENARDPELVNEENASALLSDKDDQTKESKETAEKLPSALDEVVSNLDTSEKPSVPLDSNEVVPEQQIQCASDASLDTNPPAPKLDQPDARQLIPNIPIVADSKVTQRQLSLLEVSNRALVRTQMIQQRALSLLSKPNGKGRQLTLQEEESLQQFDVVEMDDDIEIVEITDAKEREAERARVRAQAGEQEKVGIEEKNRRLKALAAAQNRARREEEAREYAEALEAKKRKREEKKAARQNNGSGDDSGNERDDNKFQKLQRIQRTETLPVDENGSIQKDDEVAQVSATIHISGDLFMSEANEAEEEDTQKPMRRTKSTFLVDDDDEEKKGPEVEDDSEVDDMGSASERDRGSASEPEESEDESENEHDEPNDDIRTDSGGIQLDDEGFAVNSMEVDLNQEFESTQAVLGEASQKIELPSKKQSIELNDSLHQSTSKPHLEQPSSSIMTANTIPMDDDNQDLLGMLSGQFPDEIASLAVSAAPKRVQQMKSRTGASIGGTHSSRLEFPVDEGEDDQEGEMKEVGNDDILGLLSGVFPDSSSTQKSSSMQSKNTQEVEDNNNDDVISQMDEEQDGNVADDDRNNDESDDDDDEDEDEENVAGSAESIMPSPTKNAHSMLMDRAAHFQTEAPQLPKMKSAFVEEEAFEEEDEFYGMGGVDGEDKGEEGPLVCSGDEDQVEDFTDVIELHRKQILDEDSKMVEDMLNDVTNGNLRKKARRNHFGKGFTLSDSDDEEEILRSLRRAGARSALLSRGGENDESKTVLERFASNPKTAAFARCFSTFKSDDEKGMISSEEEVQDSSALKAVLAKDLTLRLGRSKKEVNGPVKAKSFMSLSRTTSTVSNATSASFTDASSFGAAGGRMKLKSYRSEVREFDDEEGLPRPEMRQSMSSAVFFEEDDEVKFKLPEAGQKGQTEVPMSSSPVKMDFGSFDVSKLIKRKDSAPAAPKRSNTEDVQPLKYTSRASSGPNRSFMSRSSSAVGSAFIRSSKLQRSPTTNEKLRTDVMNSNGGVDWNRASAGGLDAKIVPNSKKSGGSNQGFLIGEAARRNVAESAALAGVRETAVLKRSASATSAGGSTGAKLVRGGSLLNVLSK